MIANTISAPPGAYAGDTGVAAGAVTGIGATTSFCSIALTAKEKPVTWRVRGRYAFTAGAPVAADANNIRLVYQSQVLWSPMLSFPAITTLPGQWNTFEFIFNDQGISG